MVLLGLQVDCFHGNLGIDLSGIRSHHQIPGFTGRGESQPGEAAASPGGVWKIKRGDD